MIKPYYLLISPKNTKNMLISINVLKNNYLLLTK
ncbi:hypothetical protein SAMN05421540_10823 [Psychroflexus halocasei]|uniref:Uncharacterized protein n=1 Tax=Psychroflexus halocasei TaxID=908615 RepID=A0A1H4CHW5_9FLAO|nr:hypothetical protein SAMN05421540_10823 [Psychroflexus halocasei]